MNDEQREFNTRWVTALTSGSFSQVEGAPHTSEGFCCLGVMCDISGVGEWKPDVEDSYFNYAVDGTLCGGFPITDVLFSFGMTENQAAELATMNDTGKSFAEIAAQIKEWMI